MSLVFLFSKKQNSNEFSAELHYAKVVCEKAIALDGLVHPSHTKVKVFSKKTIYNEFVQSHTEGRFSKKEKHMRSPNIRVHVGRPNLQVFPVSKTPTDDEARTDRSSRQEARTDVGSWTDISSRQKGLAASRQYQVRIL